VTRSRRRKLQRMTGSLLVAGINCAHAADQPAPAGDGALQEVVVTAQKTSENLQQVPISVEVLSAEKLQQLDIVNLDDYVKYSPSVSYARGIGQGGNAQPGTSHIYMRGVVSGGDGNHSGPQPSVGVYFDEQPVTTIDGTLDVHVYDVQRIEVLEGPQGTLYGASSESGTIRIISNKPDPSRFEAGYQLDGNLLTRDDNTGYQAEGFINVPLTDWAAVRLVAWDEHDAGYISNVAGSNAQGCIHNGVRTFPSWSGEAGGTPYACPAPGVVGAGAITNQSYLANDYNTVDTLGGRAAAKFDLGDSWTITPTVMGQTLGTNGFFGFDPAVGDLQVTHYSPENSQDSWIQSALTVEGKVSNFDLVYAGSYLKHNVYETADYSDYSEFYDRAYGSGVFWQDTAGAPVDPLQIVFTKGYFQKWSHELRLTTPQDLPVHGTIGAFIQRQQHDIWQQYMIPGYGYTSVLGSGNPDGFSTDLSPIAGINEIWLTTEQRVDRDKAVFAQATWDITSQLSLTGGIRHFTFENSLQGFYGFSQAYDSLLGSSTGAATCFAPATTPYAPCQNLNNVVSGNGNVPRVNLTYRITPEVMVYATFSKGFRPGGVNRTAMVGVGPYQSDFLTNYEVGWKSQWLGNTVRWNGAIFQEDWKNFQFSFLGPNSLNIIENGGNARIRGLESNLEWAVTRGLNLSANFTLLDPVITQNYCGVAGETDCSSLQTSELYLPGGVWNGPLAPKGTNLPVTPKFKGNLTARYTFTGVGDWLPFAQVSAVYQTQVSPSLRADWTQIEGMVPAYGLLDLAAGVTRDTFSLQLYVTNLADRRAELSRFTETTPTVDPQVYVVPVQPRTIGVTLSQKF
jgi:iron complex outermembrane recepter protein